MEAHFGSPYVEYERVTKYNFTREELGAMVEVIYCIKSVAQVLRRHEAGVSSCVRRYVYQRTQNFVQHTVLPILHRAHKRKLVCTKVLHDVRMTVRCVVILFVVSTYYLLIGVRCVVSAETGRTQKLPLKTF